MLTILRQMLALPVIGLKDALRLPIGWSTTLDTQRQDIPLRLRRMVHDATQLLRSWSLVAQKESQL